MSKRRVVITGMGIVSPVGNTLDAAWDSIKNGRSGIGPSERQAHGLGVVHSLLEDRHTRLTGALFNHVIAL